MNAELPRAPALDWPSLSGTGLVNLPSVDQLAHGTLTTSGRAALFLALAQLKLPTGSGVLVPTYHCPTMVAAIVHAQLTPVFYGIDESGLPNLSALGHAAASSARAMIAAHFFGIPRSLALVRSWCDERKVALIEDCAHCFFGQAGERPVGQWGDYAIASLTKFFPVPEAGLLASARHPLSTNLRPQSLRMQIKGVVDVMEFAQRANRLPGLRRPLGWLFAMKNGRSARPVTTDAALVSVPVEVPSDPLQGCDMSRSSDRPLAIARAIFHSSRRAPIAESRRANYRRLLTALRSVQGARVLFDTSPDNAVPYALPLWVDDADRVYHGLRQQGLPVFRWDHRWPGTPSSADDAGHRWGTHVLQLLCHQTLRETDMDTIAASIKTLLKR